MRPLRRDTIVSRDRPMGARQNLALDYNSPYGPVLQRWKKKTCRTSHGLSHFVCLFFIILGTLAL